MSLEIGDGDGNVPEAILKIIWGMLWNKNGPFYLPNLIANGGDSIGPLGDRPVKDLGPFALFDKDPWGTVSISLKDANVSGLSTIGDGGFTFDSSTQIFTAKLNFQQVNYNGRYVIDGSGLAGCAVAGVTGLLGLFPGRGAAASEHGSEFDDEHIVLARNYQSQLVNSPAGLSLVGSYYDNNDAMNEIVRGQTYFNHQFPRFKTAGKTSRDYADQTTAAARAPDDPMKTVGDANYKMHAFLMQTIFSRSAQDLYVTTKDPKYTQAATATLNFKSEVDNAPIHGATTVSNVMKTVQDSAPIDLKSPAPRPTQPPPAEYLAALEEIEADHARWLKSHTPKPFSELQAAAALNLGEGRFWDQFTVPSLTVSGTVTTTGEPPNISLVVNLTKISASIPQLNIALSTDLPGTLYETVVNALANANFVKDLMNTQVNDSLASPTVLSYLNDVINKAIAKVG